VDAFTLYERASEEASKYLNQTTGRHAIHFGDSKTTLVPLLDQRPNFKADLMFIDGEKTKSGRIRDIQLLRKYAHNNTRVFMDEVNSIACVSGAVGEHHPACRNNYHDAPLAYNFLARSHDILVKACSSDSNKAICYFQYNF